MRIFILLIGAVSVLLQQQTAPRIDVPVQKLVANVVGPNGRFVDGLQARDFIVQENGVQKEIGRFLPDSESPVSIGVLIDTSGSMATSATRSVRGGSRAPSPRWAAAVGTTRALLHLTKPQDEFQLMSFNATMVVTQAFTHDHNKIESHLREMGPNGFGTNISGAVDTALKEMKKAVNRRRGLVVITDVEDNEGGGIAALRRTLHTEEVPVYIFALRPEGQVFETRPQVGVGAQSRPVDETLKTVSKEGEGQYLVVDVDRLQGEQTAVKIVEFVTQFAKDVRGQYTISYLSSVTDDRQQDRAIRVRTVNPDFTVRYRRD